MFHFFLQKYIAYPFNIYLTNKLCYSFKFIIIFLSGNSFHSYINVFQEEVTPSILYLIVSPIDPLVIILILINDTQINLLFSFHKVCCLTDFYYRYT